MIRSVSGWNQTPAVYLLMTTLGRTDLVELLLQHGASPNLHAAEDNVTPLHEAASAGFIDVVKLLVARGADTKVRWGGDIVYTWG